MKTLKNKIKQLAVILTGAVIIGIGIVGNVCADNGGIQMQHKPQSFLGNYENLCLSNNTTITNYQYGLQVLGMVGQYWSNVVTLSTNTGPGSNIFPNAFTDVKLFPDANGNVSTNNAIVLYLNNTNVVNLPNQQVIFTGTNTNCIVLTTASTNTVTVTIQKIPFDGNLGTGGYPFSPIWTNTGVLSADTWSFTTPALPTGTQPYVFTTNAPSWMYYGAKAFHVTTVVSSSSSSSPGVLISGMYFVSWAW